MTADTITVGSFSSAARAATGVVVVIDVFRAFTTAAVALANGAARIVMVDDLDYALSLREQGLGRICIGERRGIKPAGFDYGNSPAEIRRVRFDGQTIIQTTTNGTRGVVAANGARRIYAGALVTAQATAQVILAAPERPVSLVAMGHDDHHRTVEDELCALYLRSRMLGAAPDRTALHTVIKTMSPPTDTRSLTPEDVACCLAADTVPFAVRVTMEDGFHVATADHVGGGVDG